MSKKNHDRLNDDGFVDELLRKTLKDDLPETAAQEMGDQLFAFRQKMTKAEAETVDPVTRLLNYIAVGNMSRAVLAFTSIFLVILGSLLHMSGPQNALADSVSAMGAARFTMKQMNQSESMHCTVRVHEGVEAPLKYAIQWKRSGQRSGATMARANCPLKAIEQSLWVREDNSGIFVNEKQNKEEKIQNMPQWRKEHNGMFKPIAALLSPSALSERLKGKWLLTDSKTTGGKELATYMVVTREQPEPWEIDVDMITCLPVSMRTTLPGPPIIGASKRIKASLQLKWNVSLPALDNINKEKKLQLK